VTSLGIPFSDWLNETVSKMRPNLLLNNVSSVNGSSNILGHELSNLLLVWTVPLKYMASNKLSNLCGNMWPVWKHYNEQPRIVPKRKL